MRAEEHQLEAVSGISRRGLLAATVIAGAIAAGSLATAFALRAELARARARLVNRSSIIQSRFGALEYAEAGAGRPA